MKNEPSRQEPKKEPGDISALIAFILFAVLIAFMFSINVFNTTQILETNRLLSTFQRIDTVKDADVPIYYTETYRVGDLGYCASTANGYCMDWKKVCSEGFVSLEGQCIETIGHARKYRDFAAPFDDGGDE